MLIGVVIIEISHEEIRHDFLLYQAENHTKTYQPALEEGTKNLSPQYPVFIVPVLDYEVKPFIESTETLTKPNCFLFRCRTTCFASALENTLASSMRKPPKIFQRSVSKTLKISSRTSPPATIWRGLLF